MILFTADIHLPVSVQHPLTLAFLSFLQGQAREADALYILGDLFDGWLGDDLGLEQYDVVIQALARYRALGHALKIGHGNRDFLLKEAFFQATGAEYVAEESEVMLGNEVAVLLHGDTLCTEDHAYQAFRKQAQNPAWQAGVLALSVSDRLALLAKIKDQSQQDSQSKTEAMMDVTAQGVTDLLMRHPTCQHIIHGHTHKPRQHREAQQIQRWVVGDWTPDRAVTLLSYSADQGLLFKELII